MVDLVRFQKLADARLDLTTRDACGRRVSARHDLLGQLFSVRSKDPAAPGSEKLRSSERPGSGKMIFIPEKLADASGSKAKRETLAGAWVVKGSS